MSIYAILLLTERKKTMSETVKLGDAFPLGYTSEEEREDYLDYCAATEAIDEALAKREIRLFDEFAKELGF